MSLQTTRIDGQITPRTLVLAVCAAALPLFAVFWSMSLLF